MDDAALDAAAHAVKSARRAVTVALLAVLVAVVVLGIDYQIKASVLDEVQKARKILDEFKALAREAMTDGTGTGQAAADRSHVPDAAGNVDDASRTSAAASADADGAARPARSRAGRAGGRASGNGK